MGDSTELLKSQLITACEALVNYFTYYKKDFFTPQYKSFDVMADTINQDINYSAELKNLLKFLIDTNIAGNETHQQKCKQKIIELLDNYKNVLNTASAKYNATKKWSEAIPQNKEEDKNILVAANVKDAKSSTSLDVPTQTALEQSVAGATSNISAGVDGSKSITSSGIGNAKSVKPFKLNHTSTAFFPPSYNYTEQLQEDEDSDTDSARIYAHEYYGDTADIDTYSAYDLECIDANAEDEDPNITITQVRNFYLNHNISKIKEYLDKEEKRYFLNIIQKLIKKLTLFFIDNDVIFRKVYDEKQYDANIYKTIYTNYIDNIITISSTTDIDINNTVFISEINKLLNILIGLCLVKDYNDIMFTVSESKSTEHACYKSLIDGEQFLHDYNYIDNINTFPDDISNINRFIYDLIICGSEKSTLIYDFINILKEIDTIYKGVINLDIKRLIFVELDVIKNFNNIIKVLHRLLLLYHNYITVSHNEQQLYLLTIDYKKHIYESIYDSVLKSAETELNIMDLLYKNISLPYTDIEYMKRYVFINLVNSIIINIIEKYDNIMYPLINYHIETRETQEARETKKRITRLHNKIEIMYENYIFMSITEQIYKFCYDLNNTSTLDINLYDTLFRLKEETLYGIERNVQLPSQLTNETMKDRCFIMEAVNSGIQIQTELTLRITTKFKLESYDNDIVYYIINNVNNMYNGSTTSDMFHIEYNKIGRQHVVYNGLYLYLSMIPLLKNNQNVFNNNVLEVDDYKIYFNKDATTYTSFVSYNEHTFLFMILFNIMYAKLTNPKP